jgi:deazaflavin-dependent oxidoreductase (nitroreductase family)
MDIGEQLAGWGKAARIETRGRVSGRPAQAHVGFIEEPDGSIVVAAGPRAHWAANLLAEPDCTVTVGERSFVGVAEPLEGPEFAAAIRELILRYGTPAERLGSGPAFRIRPARPVADRP